MRSHEITAAQIIKTQLDFCCDTAHSKHGYDTSSLALLPTQNRV